MKNFEIIDSKKVLPKQLPKGCIISANYKSKRQYGKINAKKELQFADNGTTKTVALDDLTMIKIHDIVDKDGNSTHIKMYIATNYHNITKDFSPDKPIRSQKAKKWFSKKGYVGFSNVKEHGQKWVDEPWTNWVKA